MKRNDASHRHASAPPRRVATARPRPAAKVASKVPAAENTLRILKLLASKRGPMAASNIATALGLPRSSVYHLLGVMEANGFVLHLHEEQRYGLGISAFELSSAYSRQEPLSRLGRPLLASLVDVDRRKRPPGRAARPRCALHRGGAGQEPARPW